MNVTEVCYSINVIVAFTSVDVYSEKNSNK